MIFYVLKIYLSAELRGGFGCRAKGRTKDFLLDFIAFHLCRERPDESRQEAAEEYFVQKNIFLIAIEHPIEAGAILPAFDWRDIMFTITIKKRLYLRAVLDFFSLCHPTYDGATT
jgi:hypothetical protein